MTDPVNSSIFMLFFTSLEMTTSNVKICVRRMSLYCSYCISSDCYTQQHQT